MKDLTVLHADVHYLGTRHPGSTTQFPFHALATLWELPWCLSLPCPARTDLLPFSQRGSRGPPTPDTALDQGHTIILQNTPSQTQSQQPYIHVSPMPRPELSCLSPAASKEPTQALLQGTSLWSAPHWRVEVRRWPCQPQEGDTGGEIWQLTLLFSPSDHPHRSAADLRDTSRRWKPLPRENPSLRIAVVGGIGLSTSY